MKLSDSRTIYNVTRLAHHNVEWQNLTIDNGAWMYYGDSKNFQAHFLESINRFLEDGNIYVSLSRTGSFLITKENLGNEIVPLIGNYDFVLWNFELKRAVEINRTGVLRYGITRIANL